MVHRVLGVWPGELAENQEGKPCKAGLDFFYIDHAAIPAALHLENLSVTERVEQWKRAWTEQVEINSCKDWFRVRCPKVPIRVPQIWIEEGFVGGADQLNQLLHRLVEPNPERGKFFLYPEDSRCFEANILMID